MRKSLIITCIVLVTLASGCSFGANMRAGISQGGLANPIALLSGALVNSAFNGLGWLPKP
jgi:hypothetical protein